VRGFSEAERGPAVRIALGRRILSITEVTQKIGLFRSVL
jgi:hypothetical protein